MTTKGKAIEGRDVYRRLMDLDLLLQDGESMIVLHQFLTSVSDGHPALIRLDTEIAAFQVRLQALVDAAKKREGT